MILKNFLIILLLIIAYIIIDHQLDKAKVSAETFSLGFDPPDQCGTDDFQYRFMRRFWARN